MAVFSEEVANILISGGIGIIPTDTIYGIVGRAEIPETVEKIYNIRKRDINKPCIILITAWEDLEKFNIEVSAETKAVIYGKRLWPGKVSIVLPSVDPRFNFLSRGTGSLAFRMPDSPELLALLKKTGPLVAPSANMSGELPATHIAMARESFKDSVDFYVDGGNMESLPSTLITFQANSPVVLREGAVKI